MKLNDPDAITAWGSAAGPKAIAIPHFKPGNQYATCSWVGLAWSEGHEWGVTELMVIDNLKSGVSKVCRYEPDINPIYQEMAAHYGTAVLPVRVRKLRDRAKVEVEVQLVERWILATLRKRTFFSLAELNQAIRELLDRLNNRPFKKLPSNRRSMSESLDKPALKPLPATAYQYGQ
ncbi:hypothetical protein DFAR_1370004 [Desulfarculales bacterium]